MFWKISRSANYRFRWKTGQTGFINADCVVTFCKPENSVLMIQMQGYLTKQEFLKGLDMCIEKSQEIY